MESEVIFFTLLRFLPVPSLLQVVFCHVYRGVRVQPSGIVQTAFSLV